MLIHFFDWSCHGSPKILERTMEKTKHNKALSTLEKARATISAGTPAVAARRTTKAATPAEGLEQREANGAAGQSIGSPWRRWQDGLVPWGPKLGLPWTPQNSRALKENTDGPFGCASVAYFARKHAHFFDVKRLEHHFSESCTTGWIGELVL